MLTTLVFNNGTDMDGEPRGKEATAAAFTLKRSLIGVGLSWVISLLFIWR